MPWLEATTASRRRAASRAAVISGTSPTSPKSPRPKKEAWKKKDVSSPAVNSPRWTSFPPRWHKPSITPLAAKSSTACAMPRPRAAFEATSTTSSQCWRNSIDSGPARENHRTRSANCNRSSAKDKTSLRAAASFEASLLADFPLARDPRKAPVTSRGQTARLSFPEVRNIVMVPPRTEAEKRSTFCSFPRPSAQSATSLSSTAAGESIDASACAFSVSPSGVELGPPSGSARRRAVKTSAAIDARSRSAALSKMTVRRQPAVAPKPNKNNPRVTAPLLEPEVTSSIAFLSCAPVRKFTKDATPRAPAPTSSRGASGRRCEASHPFGSSMAQHSGSASDAPSIACKSL
mmetsp:Transcript_103290/g.179194  ORF Transcript_103290/g.179194 Transcript_103290/m.179194 type:complete len:348 (-) Transcript_103290:21-1064(-)